MCNVLNQGYCCWQEHCAHHSKNELHEPIFCDSIFALQAIMKVKGCIWEKKEATCCRLCSPIC